jgi:hypothetical protein
MGSARMSLLGPPGARRPRREHADGSGSPHPPHGLARAPDPRRALPPPPHAAAEQHHHVQAAQQMTLDAPAAGSPKRPATKQHPDAEGEPLKRRRSSLAPAGKRSGGGGPGPSPLGGSLDAAGSADGGDAGAAEEAPADALRRLIGEREQAGEPQVRGRGGRHEARPMHGVAACELAAPWAAPWPLSNRTADPDPARPPSARAGAARPPRQPRRRRSLSAAAWTRSRRQVGGARQAGPVQTTPKQAACSASSLSCLREPALSTLPTHPSHTTHLVPLAADAAEAVTAFLDEFDRLAQERAEAGEDEEALAPEDEEMAEAGGSGLDEEGGGRGGGKRRRQPRGRGAPSTPAAAAPRRPRLARPFVPLRRLQQLAQALSQARGAGALPQVELGLLGRLLAALEGHVEVGMDRIVADDEQTGSPAYDAVAAALEAAACCLQARLGEESPPRGRGALHAGQDGLHVKCSQSAACLPSHPHTPAISPPLPPRCCPRPACRRSCTARSW